MSHYSDDEAPTSDDEDSAGSLVDFIVDDEEEEDVVVMDEEEEGFEFVAGTSDAGDDDDGDCDVRQQYNTRMEEEGLVKNERGLFRSRRSTQGQPPDRYVSENHSALLLDDVGSEVEFVFSDSGCSSGGEDEEDEDYIDE
jgi:hypothetical protein